MGVPPPGLSPSSMSSPTLRGLCGTVGVTGTKVKAPQTPTAKGYPGKRCGCLCLDRQMKPRRTPAPAGGYREVPPPAPAVGSPLSAARGAVMKRRGSCLGLTSPLPAGGPGLSLGSRAAAAEPVHRRSPPVPSHPAPSAPPPPLPASPAAGARLPRG